MTEDEKFVEDVMAFAESEEGDKLADAAMQRYNEMTPDKKVLELKEEDILKVLKVSYIAKRFFGRSRSWMANKLNHNLVNGKPATFTPQEREKLKDALDTIAYEIQILSDSL